MYREQLRRRCVRSAKWLVVAGLLFALIALVTPPRATQQPILKIGFVDMARLFNEYDRTKVLSAEFEAKRNKAQEDIESRRAPLLELDRKLKDEADTLIDEERTALEERFKEEYANWRDYATDKDRQLRRDEQKIEKDLLQELQKAVNDYGTREGYSMIFRTSLLLYGAQTYDLTDEVLQNVNQ